jgi:5-methylcytosine-specific restriction endonuclease McrA
MLRVHGNTGRSRGPHRTTLPRAPRGLSRRARPDLHADHKRSLKRATLRDCGRRCVYCGTCLELHETTLDHVLPLARGGPHTPGNVVAACGPCNRRKGDMLPHDFFQRYPTAGLNFLAYARAVHRALKRGARKAVSLAMAA